MLLVKQWAVFFFLTLIALISSTSNNQTNCTRQFEFPNLKDSQHIISAYSNENISVEFSVHSTCSTHFTGVYTILDKDKQVCAFLRQNGNCENYSDNKYCRCPKEGSDLYRMEIPADKGNTIWTWKSVPSLVKEHNIHIVILDGTAPGSTEVSTSNTPATNNVHMQISTFEHIDTRDSKAADSNTTTATVATCTGIITAVIVTIAWAVVYRYKTKVTIRRRLAPQHDLALQEIQDCNQQPPDSAPAQPQQQQQQQQRRLPEIPGQYQVPFSVPASSGLDARQSVGRVSHVYEVVGGTGDQEGEVPEVLKTELPDTNLHPRPPVQMTAAQASKPGFGNGLYFHIHPTK